MERDPYVVLGVKRDASDRAIREAYYTRARAAHPDIVGSGGLDMMRALNEAWSILKDPERRLTYDNAHGGRPTPPPDVSSGSPAGRKPVAGQPAWTGAAGHPPGRPWGHVLDFGIYAGWSLGEIARRDRGYLVWLRDRSEAKSFRPEIEQLLIVAGGDSGTAPAKGKRETRSR
jgi:curved DNA-binding protein CbpA